MAGQAILASDGAEGGAREPSVAETTRQVPADVEGPPEPEGAPVPTYAIGAPRVVEVARAHAA